jgi:hypothetical protein
MDLDLKHPPSDMIFSPLLNMFRPLHHTIGLQCFVSPDGHTGGEVDLSSDTMLKNGSSEKHIFISSI